MRDDQAQRFGFRRHLKQASTRDQSGLQRTLMSRMVKRLQVEMRMAWLCQFSLVALAKTPQVVLFSRNLAHAADFYSRGSAGGVAADWNAWRFVESECLPVGSWTYGLDMTPEMLDLANANKARAGVETTVRGRNVLNVEA